MPWHFTYNTSTLVQVMTWCLMAPSHYLSQCGHSSMSPYGVTSNNELIRWSNHHSDLVLDVSDTLSGIWLNMLINSCPYITPAPQYILYITGWINSLWECHMVSCWHWWDNSLVPSPLAEVMAWYLMAPSHYLNQYWYITTMFLRCKSLDIFYGNVNDITDKNIFNLF